VSKWYAVRLIIDNFDNLQRAKFLVACAFNFEEVVSALTTEVDVGIDVPAGLSVATEYGSEAVVKLLLNRDNIETLSERGMTPLWLAAEAGH
jgi:hypothetical protein